MELAAGTRIDRYVLLEPLGQGGQGAVWKAEDPLEPGRPCALKLVEINPSRPADAERVRREARALTRLEHPSLVRCYSLFEELRQGLLGVAMELVDGASLRHVRDDPRFGPDERAALLRHIAHALAYVHGQGVVHRDLKPDNILVSSVFFEHSGDPSNVKLVDFGIAAEEGNPQPLTLLNSVIGTLAFLAPELIDPSFFKAPGATPAVDVFAFGVLTWQVLMDSAHPTGLQRATLVEYGVAYRRAAELGTGWPEERPAGAWGELLQGCLAIRAEDRIRNGAELAARCDLAARTSAILRPEPAPGSLLASVPTAVASPGAMLGHTEAQSVSPAPPLPGAPAGLNRPPPPAASANPHVAPRARKPARGRRALRGGLALLVLAGAGAAFAVLRDPGSTGKRPVTTTMRALPALLPNASASASMMEPDAGAPPAASAVLVFSPASALPENCDHDAGICACCPSGRDCSPGVCGDSLEADQSWLLRAGPIRPEGSDLIDAQVCIRIEGLGPAKCLSANGDPGQPARLHVDTPDLVDRGIVVEVHAAGGSARTSTLRYSDGLKREVLCSGLLLTGFDGKLRVDSVRLFLDPDRDGAAAVKCPAP